MMSTQQDLRKHPRLSPLIIRAQYQSNDGDGEGYLLNLSEGGVFLATNENLSVDDSVRLQISLPWRIGAIRVDSKVVWCRDTAPGSARNLPAGVGLEFTHLSSQDAEKLKTYMQKFKELVEQINKED
jgi:uncharacterized protein (TIGR02266 family)